MILVFLAAGVADVAADEMPVRKVVRRYALTSANDFQQRDPLNWQLLGSNDDGKTWVTLDTRREQFFEERHQRRVFELRNANAYNVYRLQVDLVREPKDANSIQLAEFEAMGDDPDDFSPTPIFCDQITAQGENPPLEMVTHLFDGKVETKWLDRPRERTTCASWVQWKYVAPAATLITNIAQVQGLRVRAEDGYRVKLSGVIVGRGAQPGNWIVLDETGVLEVHCDSETNRFLPGQPVTVEGITTWRSGSVEVAQCTINAIAAPNANVPMEITPEAELLKEPHIRWVRIAGVVQFVQRMKGGATFELRRGDTSTKVSVCHLDDEDQLPEMGSTVTVEGVCRGGYNEHGSWVVIHVWTAGVDKIEPGNLELAGGHPSNPTSTAPGSAEITKIAELRRLTTEQLAKRPFGRIRGVVTGLLGAYMQDDTAGITVAFKPQDSRRINELGQYIEVEGWLGLSDAFTPVISADRVKLLGPGKLPEPHQPAWSQLASGWMDSLWVETEGVVRATDGAHLLLNCDGRQVTASLGVAPTRVVKELVDASVRVRGVAIAALDDWGRRQGVHLLIPSLDHLHIEQEPPSAFSQPLQPIRTVLRVSGPGGASHRVRVGGILTLQSEQGLFLQDSSGSAMAIFKQEVVLDSKFGRSQWSFWRTPEKPAVSDTVEMFSPGDRVEVVGFQDSHGYSTILTEAVARKISSGEEIEPQEITASSFSNWKLDSCLVRLEGVLMGEQVVGDRLVLEIQCHGRTLQALLPAGVDFEDNFQVGTALQVTGVWQMDPVHYAELGRRVGAVRILARSPADFVVLERPPWWTLQRALMVIGGLTFVLLAASIWIRQLHRKVEQRTTQLAAEIQRREQMERQRALQDERARIARDLHDDLGAALTQIRFLSAVESRDQTVPEGTRGRMRQVTHKSHQLVSSLDEIVWAINPANDSLPSLVNYLCHAAAEFFASTPIRCRLDVDEDLPEVTLTSEARHHLYLVVREALNNIAKHAEATEVWLRFKCDGQRLEIVIEDNGRGFPAPEAGFPGDGLRNMRDRISRIGGEFSCESRPGAGTVSRIAILLSPQSNTAPQSR